MNPVTEKAKLQAGEAFQIPGEFLRAEVYGSGHINDTFAAYYRLNGTEKRYILQRINTDVFKKPVELMENIAGVTKFIRDVVLAAGGDPERECLNLVLAKDNKAHFLDSEGGYWRVYGFVEDTTTFQQATDEAFYESARAFGRFSRLLADYPAQTLHETIPNFHNTPDRYLRFKEALNKDVLGRAAGVQAEIDFVLAREEDAQVLVNAQKAGELPLRVTHNDTKLNNVLIDNKSGRGLCVIDLDTVMPGLSLYDYGDSIRFGANTGAEDEPDLTKVHFSMPLFESYTKGYLEAVGDVLTQNEIDFLPMGAKIMTLECGVRFLTDYLVGDTYFKIHREGHNLDRTRTQFRMVDEMEQNWDKMAQTIKTLRKK